MLVLMLGVLLVAPVLLNAQRASLGGLLVQLNAPLPPATRFVLGIPSALLIASAVLAAAGLVWHELRRGSGVTTLAVNTAVGVLALLVLGLAYAALTLPLFEIMKTLAT